MADRPNEVMERLLAWAATQERPARPVPSDPAPEAVAARAKAEPPAPKPPFRILAKAGPLRNGAERGGGSVWHAVAGEHADGGAALCGASPAIMWSRWSPKDAKITCRRCAKLAAERFPAAG